MGGQLLKPFLLLLLFALAAPVFAQEDEPLFTLNGAFALNINSGYLGIGKNFPQNDAYGEEFFFSLLSIGVEHKNTNIGFEISPYAWTEWRSTDDNKSGINSFLNLKLYWHAVNITNFLYFGPFAAANYMYINHDAFNWDELAFTFGGQFGLRLNLENLNYNILCLETGYRVINGRSKYFVGAKADLMAFIALVVLYIVSSATDNASDSDSKIGSGRN